MPLATGALGKAQRARPRSSSFLRPIPGRGMTVAVSAPCGADGYRVGAGGWVGLGPPCTDPLPRSSAWLSSSSAPAGERPGAVGSQLDRPGLRPGAPRSWSPRSSWAPPPCRRRALSLALLVGVLAASLGAYWAVLHGRVTQREELAVYLDAAIVAAAVAALVLALFRISGAPTASPFAIHAMFFLSILAATLVFDLAVLPELRLRGAYASLVGIACVGFGFVGRSAGLAADAPWKLPALVSLGALVVALGTATWSDRVDDNPDYVRVATRLRGWLPLAAAGITLILLLGRGERPATRAYWPPTWASLSSWQAQSRGRACCSPSAANCWPKRVNAPTSSSGGWPASASCWPSPSGCWSTASGRRSSRRWPTRWPTWCRTTP